ncbi:MAG TPA: CHASE4 domain-containing protein [Methanospirillum sp.]|nr:CHASE4 domain-containing protein [Methanospirillum sp.]
MDIREKSLVVLTGIMVCVIAICIILSFTIFFDSYKKLESVHVHGKVDLVLKNIDMEINALDALVKDWGPWDDTYEFLGGENSLYIQDNLMKETYGNLNLNFIVITNREGEIVYGQGFDLEQGTFTPLRPDLIKEISDTSSPLRSLNPETRSSGFLNLPSGIVIISSYPVLRSNFSGNPRGTIIMGRYLKNTKITRLTPETNLKISITPIDLSLLSPGEFSLFSGTGDSRILTRAPDNQVVEGVVLLNDIYQREMFLLTVQVPRDIYNQGMSTILLFIYLQLTVLLILGIVIIWLLDSQVLMRIQNINHDIAVITDEESRTSRITNAGNDEISRLIDAMNRMLDQIEHNHTSLAESEKRFRELAEQFPGIMLEVNLQGCPKFINCAAYAIFGYLPGEMEQITNISELFAPKERSRLHNFGTLILGEEYLGGIEFSAMKKDGTLFPVLVYAAPVISGDQITGFRIFAGDISELKRLQEIQALAMRRIEENIHQMAVLNDQIRNPLAIIQILCDTGEFPHIIEIQNQLQIITDLVLTIDQGWVESLKVRKFLKNQFDIILTNEPEESKSGNQGMK